MEHTTGHTPSAYESINNLMCYLSVSVPTIYRWIDLRYADAAHLELRRKVFHRLREKGIARKGASHGPTRSHAAFVELPEEERDSACEMDAVTGIVRDSKCLLALYLRSCKFQLMLLLEEKTLDGMVRTLDALEKIVGTDGFKGLFAPLLTDNDSEF